MTDTHDEENLENEGDGLTTVAYFFPNGDRYEGDCSGSDSDGLVRSGIGKHTSANGLTYVGEWCKDKMHGRGSLQYPSGARYEGEVKGNMYHGAGTYTFSDGSVYKGHFHENRFMGVGTFIDAQGQVWTGEFHGKEALGLKMQPIQAKEAA
ncbi:MORN repeat-containing protein 2 [Oryzias latipes]|uniref:MORN repeat containing 2 n=1 Tax=Oryzias latipes TaxID=8090 RepID=A0A3B3HTY2_ORYLA|nr:MORN repeat-containing protein 2 [Oryzias latipes]